jgi:F-type H+-transporting ATPase subunit b
MDVNWIYGFVGESDEIDHPTILYRTPGMPVPLLAHLFNTAILFGLFYRFGRKPVMDGLARRRETLMRGMDEAAKMRADAAEQLAFYEAKLQKVDAEVTRIRTEMREAAEAERVAVLADAKKRRERMERDALHMIAQELKSAKEHLFEETVRSAVDSARQLLVESASDADHERLAEEYLGTIAEQLPNLPRGRA